MPDKIIISDCHFICHLGCTDEEQSIPQTIILDIECSFDNKRPASSDELTDTIDYCAIYDSAAEFIGKTQVHLIETIVERLAEHILSSFPLMGVHLLLKKPKAMEGRSAAWAGIEIYRSS